VGRPLSITRNTDQYIVVKAFSENAETWKEPGLLDPTPMVVTCFLGESRRAKPECSLRKEVARFKRLDEKESAGSGGG